MKVLDKRRRWKKIYDKGGDNVCRLRVTPLHVVGPTHRLWHFFFTITKCSILFIQWQVYALSQFSVWGARPHLINNIFLVQYFSYSCYLIIKTTNHIYKRWDLASLCWECHIDEFHEKERKKTMLSNKTRMWFVQVVNCRKSSLRYFISDTS